MRIMQAFSRKYAQKYVKLVLNDISYQKWRMKLFFNDSLSQENMVNKKLNERNLINFFRIEQQQNACISRILALISWKIPSALALCRNRKRTLVKTHIKMNSWVDLLQKRQKWENKNWLSFLWSWIEGSVLTIWLNLAARTMVTAGFHLLFSKPH